MNVPKSLLLVLGFFSLILLFSSGAHADRLIRRSDGVISLGVGNFDAKKQTVLFRECNDKDSKMYSLKDYAFHTGKDCDEPGIFTGLESLDIDGTVKSTKAEGCPTGQTCLQYVVESPRHVEDFFSGAKKGDKIDVFVSKVGKTTESHSTKDIDFTLRLTEKTGKVRDTLTFKNVLASDDFINKVTVKK